MGIGNVKEAVQVNQMWLAIKHRDNLRLSPAQYTIVYFDQ